MSRVHILGYPISSLALSDHVELAWQSVSTRTSSCCIACANPHALVTASSDETYSRALKTADILLPDGAGILLAARILGLPLGNRITGMDFFLGLTRYAQAAGGFRCFFLGSSEQVLEQIRERMAQDFPKVLVCGTYSPPHREAFSEAENRAMVEAVNRAKPDVLWVGMTAPKQEKWIYRNLGILEVPVLAAVGAVFDFYSSTRARAPQWVGDLGFEWLPRLVREPGRLWRRTLISAPLFLTMVARQRFANRAETSEG